MTLQKKIDSFTQAWGPDPENTERYKIFTRRLRRLMNDYARTLINQKEKKENGRNNRRENSNGVS